VDSISCGKDHLPEKTLLRMMCKLFSSVRPKHVPTRTRILDIVIFVVAFYPHNVGFSRTHTNRGVDRERLCSPTIPAPVTL